MVWNGGGKLDEEFNFIFKFLVERGKDGEIFKKYNEYFISYFILFWQLYIELNNSEINYDYIMLWVYGSLVEDLQFYDFCDVGDIDFMVFLYLDDLMIYEE